MELLPYAGVLIGTLPAVAVHLVGIILAVTRWRRHSNVSSIAVFGLGLSLLVTIVGRLVSVALPLTMRESGRTIAEVSTMMGVFAGVTTLFEAAALGLLIGAIFGWRNPARPG